MANDFSETFNTGIGALNHTWGSGIDTRIPGQVTISGDSGIMENPSGPAAGHGYGVYSITASMTGNSAGPAALLWPANDVWPGPEMDLAEFISGHVYATLHFRGSDGSDIFGNVIYYGLDATQTHTYTLDWEPRSVTFSVDGHVYGAYTNTNDVGADFAHGGVNETISIMNRDPNTSITVYDVSYRASGSGGPATTAPATTATAAHDPVIIQAADPVATSAAAPGQPAWWSAWEAAWNANHYTATSDDWQTAFWAKVAAGDWAL